MIQDIYKLHWNIIHKSTGVTWNVGPYNKQTNNNDLLETDGGTKNCIYKGY